MLLEYTLDDLESAARIDVESHLDGCPRCRQQAMSIRRLWRALPEPQPGALQPPPAAWERSWNSILERIAGPEPDQTVQGSAGGWRAGARWAAAAAACAAAFVLGLEWPDVRDSALSLLGSSPSPVNHFAGLDSFQRASDDYLQRSRLLLLELQQTGAGSRTLEDPWLVDHSRSLLGEAARHAPAARRIHNYHIERLLADLEVVLRRVLGAAQSGGIDPGLESEMGLLLFRLEMLERPAAPASAPAAL
jgi:hypothetical protein